MRIIGFHHSGLWKRVWDACRSICSEQGGALVETAVTMPILFLLLLGAAEFALVEYKAIEVSNAANAAAQYGTSSPISAADTTGIRLAATNDATNVALCICSNGTASTCAAGDCSSSHIEQILTVQTQASYTPPIHLPGLPMTFALQGLAVRKVLQ
jgi:Flp pilus assembly protein TadG